jgi:hypothetical protein
MVTTMERPLNVPHQTLTEEAPSREADACVDEALVVLSLNHSDPDLFAIVVLDKNDAWSAMVIERIGVVEAVKKSSRRYVGAIIKRTNFSHVLEPSVPVHAEALRKITGFCFARMMPMIAFEASRIHLGWIEVKVGNKPREPAN